VIVNALQLCIVAGYAAGLDPTYRVDEIFTAVGCGAFAIGFAICVKAVLKLDVASINVLLIRRGSLVGVCTVLAVCFAARAVFNYLTVIGKFTPHVGCTTTAESIEVFSFFIVFEVYYVIMILS
jgi:hypothetical protein